MEAQWICHLVGSDEGDLSCTVDVAHAENAPDAQRTLCTLVTIPFKDAGEEGFGDQSERSVLVKYEDEIASKSEKLGVLHVVSVRGAGRLDVLYYSNAAAEQPLKAIVETVCRGYEVQVTSFPDPDWKEYENLFPPPEAIAEDLDIQLISVLSEQGDRMDRKRPVDHALLFPSSTAADQAAAAAAKLGYKETERHEDNDGEFPITLQITKPHNVEPDTIAERRAELTELAEKFDGTYDGWASPVVK
jgi:regulator of RNase E activity RraB